MVVLSSRLTASLNLQNLNQIVTAAMNDHVIVWRWLLLVFGSLDDV